MGILIWSGAPGATPLSFLPSGNVCRWDQGQDQPDPQGHFQEELPASGAAGLFPREDRFLVKGSDGFCSAGPYTRV